MVHSGPGGISGESEQGVKGMGAEQLPDLPQAVGGGQRAEVMQGRIVCRFRVGLPELGIFNYKAIMICFPFTFRKIPSFPIVLNKKCLK